MSYFVYYNDGFYDDGDVGLKVCESSSEVEEFIVERMSQDPSRRIDMYTVIQGTQRKIESVTVVSKVRLI